MIPFSNFEHLLAHLDCPAKPAMLLAGPDAQALDAQRTFGEGVHEGVHYTYLPAHAQWWRTDVVAHMQSVRAELDGLACEGAAP